MLLITTALKETFPKQNNERVLFLGTWCQSYKAQKNNAKIVPYHWDDRDKLLEDSEYIELIYQNYLTILAQKLNHLHQVEYSKKYWNVFIGLWLKQFVGVIYDRYLSIKSLEKYPISQTYGLSYCADDFIPFDISQSIVQYDTDEWNHYIYSFLIKKITQIPIEILGELQSIDKKTQKDGVVKNIALRVISILNKRSQVYFNMAYFDKKFRTQLQRSLGELSFFPDVPFNIKRFRVESNKLRNQLTFDQTDNKFEQILNDLIPMLMPKVYLDGYQTLNKKATQLYPKKPKVILTANSFAYNDGFKIWAASMQEQGTRYCISQHGGYYGSALITFTEDYEQDVADCYYNWGWSNKSNTKIMPANKLQSLSSLSKYDINGAILMPLLVVPRYGNNPISTPISSQFISYLVNQINFLKLMPNKVKDLVKIRPHHNDCGWRVIDRLNDVGFSGQIDTAENLKKPFIQRLSSCRLCIATYNATTYLETFANNFPTLLYWDRNYWELREEAQPYFDELHRVGILHYEAQSLADKVEEIYLDPMAWWQQVEIQTVRENFCQQFAHVGDNPLKEWQDELKYQAGLSEQ